MCLSRMILLFNCIFLNFHLYSLIKLIRNINLSKSMPKKVPWHMIYLKSTATEELKPKNIDIASCQNSRQGLFSMEKFHYLNVPHIGISAVYDDFECIFKCLHQPLCISVNLATEGKLWCELLPSDKYCKPKEYKQNKNYNHYFIKVRFIHAMS